jgi:dipeptidyl aminopeptidase/acylaminoacyl peptidase
LGHTRAGARPRHRHATRVAVVHDASSLAALRHEHGDKDTMIPLAAADAARAAVNFDELSSADGAVYWLESSPLRQGRTALMGWNRAEGRRQVTPDEFDVGGHVHGYGGGAYAVTPSGAWCVSASDGLTYRFEGGCAYRITSEDPGSSEFGDLVAYGDEVLAVREDAEGDALVAFTSAGTERVLTRTAGFLAAPCPAAGRLAWLRWGSDQMPWDGCELWTGSYRPGGRIDDQRRVAGGDEEAVTQPQWGPDGRLYFVSDRSGWWNLYRWDGGMVEPVAPMAAECAAAPWELGYRSYAILPDGRVAIVVQEGPHHRLVVAEQGGRVRPVELPYTSMKPYVAALGDAVALIASSPRAAPEAVLVNVDAGGRVEVLARADTTIADTAIAAWLAVPEEVTVSSVDRLPITALVYPPAGAEPGWQAPLVVRAHPGPTASMSLRLDWQVQFFTSQGFAVADVDYRGSTGYGRSFRQRLYGRWGCDDVADCRAVAEHLLAEGRTTPGEIFIFGASAGGYTALQAVSSSGPFAAAAARSSIVDPGRWASTAPRFQRPHAAQLSGGAVAVQAERIQAPVLLVHGSNDRIAPVQDALDLAGGLRSRGCAHDLVVVDGAGHGLSNPDHLAAALGAELRFFQTMLTRHVPGAGRGGSG